MNTSQEPGLAPGSEPARGSARWAILGPGFAFFWLFFLLNPLHAGWLARDTPEGVLGFAATIVFAAVYMLIWMRARRLFRVVQQPPPQLVAPYLAALGVLASVMIGTLGEVGMASLVYLAVACVMTLPPRIVLVPIVCIAVGVACTGLVPGWGSQIGTAFGVCAASAAMFGVRSVIQRNIALLSAQHENTRLALADERNRFARDLHDILGHSLTVITVKAELAQRLVDTAPERAKAELADLERLSRDALADVRRAVEGYRELTLPGELARARAALEAAGIEPVLPQSADEVPSGLRELFAWTIREGVTNVIRHSGALRCEITLTPTSVTVHDDGHGAGDARAGSGLAGLRERAEAMGAVLTTRTSSGFDLVMTADLAAAERKVSS
ncbi:two-component system sensor histidine kinase DesK [Nocardioides luteus]|nr:histidine kinase [Nocardioides luteus]MDR7311520.1 two-component system sensor histidine kinase DesK [Nocardioides luteus]